MVRPLARRREWKWARAARKRAEEGHTLVGLLGSSGTGALDGLGHVVGGVPIGSSQNNCNEG